MKIHDVTVTLSPQLPTWPGDPKINIERFTRIEEGADANTSRLDMCVHSGTHIDAPYHFIANGAKVEDLKLDTLIGLAVVVRLPDTVDQIDRKALESAGIPRGVERLLLKTRNSQIWERAESTFQTDFAGVTRDGADYLISQGLHLVGIDYLSIAPFQDPTPTHQALLGAGIVVIEGLNLSAVTPGIYQLYCLPIKLGGVEGAPARVVLIEE